MKLGDKRYAWLTFIPPTRRGPLPAGKLAPPPQEVRRGVEEHELEHGEHRCPGGGEVRERRLAKFRQNVARFRLYRLRFLQENMRFAAFFKIYQILKLKFLKFDKILQILIFDICNFLLKFHENC